MLSHTPTFETLTFKDFLRLYPRVNELYDEKAALSDTQNIVNHVALLFDATPDEAENMSADLYFQTQWLYKLADYQLYFENLEKPVTLKVGNKVFDFTQINDLQPFRLTNIQLQAIEDVTRSLDAQLLSKQGVFPLMVRILKQPNKHYTEILNESEVYNFERYINDLGIGRKRNIHRIVAPFLQPAYDNSKSNIIRAENLANYKFNYDEFTRSRIETDLLDCNLIELMRVGFFLSICLRDIYILFINDYRASVLQQLQTTLYSNVMSGQTMPSEQAAV